MIENDEQIFLDARGLICPMPLLKAKQRLNAMKPKQRLSIQATDPGSMKDFEVFAERSGHMLLKAEKKDDVYYYLLQKS